jgi:hypothetical protein
MNSLGKALSRSLVTLAAAGLGLALIPTTASAEIVFTVDETVVPDAAPVCPSVTFGTCVFEADKLNGLYGEILTINPDFSFDVSAAARFELYGLGLGEADSVLLGLTEGVLGFDGGYGLYALFDASGAILPSGEIAFGLAGATVSLFMDPDQDTTFAPPLFGTGAWTLGGDGEDIEILSSSTLLTGTGELTPPVGGFFDLAFKDLILTAFGEDYYPSLSTLSLVFATVDGDFDAVPAPPIAGTYRVKGDVSVVYDITAVPEPATLSLLGFGLFSAGVAARRRRRQTLC